MREVERLVEALLTTLFPASGTSAGWKGWQYTSPDAIDVYQVPPWPRAVQVLHSRGFGTVTLHSHRAERYLTCMCRVYER